MGVGRPELVLGKRLAYIFKCITEDNNRGLDFALRGVTRIQESVLKTFSDNGSTVNIFRGKHGYCG